MDIDYHASIKRYVDFGQLPLWVAGVKQGRHPERKFHDHEFIEVVIVSNGSARHLTGSSSTHLKTGDVVVIHPGTVHAYDQTDDFELVNILYDHTKLPMPMLDGNALPLFKAFFPERVTPGLAEVVINLKPDDLEEIVARVFKLEDELKSMRPGNLFAGMALFMEIMVRLTRLGSYEIPEQRKRFLIGDAVSYLNKYYARKISVDELAKVANMSRRNFFRSFRLMTGSGPVEYLMKIRIQHASNMLINTDLSIGEIAENCGFYDSNFFCRKFREHVGCSPRSFRLTGKSRI